MPDHRAKSNVPAARGSRRRTMWLVLLSLAVVGVVMAIAQLGVEAPPQPTVAPAEPPEIHDPFLAGRSQSSTAGDLQIDGLKITAKEDLGITILEEGTLRKKIHMTYSQPQQLDGSGKRFHVQYPVVTYYMKRGQKAVIRADEAILTSRHRDKIDPQKGTFKGHVRIFVDRRTDAWQMAHPALAERPSPSDMLARLWLEEMRFDLELGRLIVPGAVRIEAREMQLEGTGLTVRWSEETGRIEELTLDQGDHLAFSGGFDMGLSLTNEEPEPQSESEGEPASQAAPLVDAGAVERSETDPQPAAPAPRQRVALDEVTDDVLIIDVPDESGDTAPLRVVSYEVDFGSDVLAKQDGAGQGRLQADRLSVLVDLPASMSAQERGGRDRRRSAPQATAEGAPQSASGDGLVLVTWEGPLKIRCLGEAEDWADPLRRHLTATGSPVVMENRDGRATCAALVRRVESGFTELRGSAQHAIKLAGNDDFHLFALDLVTLDIAERRAVLHGAVEVGIDTSRLQGRQVEAFFREPQPGQGRSLRDLLDVLECDGNVDLTDENGQLRCRHLTVHMSPDAQGRNLPKHAHAVDDIEFRQLERILSASKMLDLTFGELPADSQGQVVDDAPTVQKLAADGQVRFVDPRRDWDIAGESLNCAFDDRQVVTSAYIEGRPDHNARVKMGAYYIEGRTVEFDDVRQWAHVPGAGIARFVISEDLDGRRTADPVPLEVQWDDEMTLLGDRNTLIFAGRTVSKSRDNILRADRLQISLKELPPPPQARQAPGDPLNMWFLRPFRPELNTLIREDSTRRPRPRQLRKKPTTILAEHNATLESRTADLRSGRLKSLLTLSGPKIAFDLEAKVLNVEGQGQLVIEDYPTLQEIQLARQAGRAEGLFGTAQSEGLSQTVVLWDAAMHYYYAQRVAEFAAQQAPVQLIHRSGKHIVMTETRSHQIQMTTEQLRRLRQAELGRKTDLNCRHLLVEFRPGSSRQGGAGQMSLGELRQVQARGEVLLDDSQWFVTGDRLDYVDDSGLVSVYGPAGQDAYISGLDDQASQVFEAKCPQLHLELKTGAVDAPGCKVRYRSGGAGQ